MDPSAFFTLHDYDNSGSWMEADIRRTYGLDDESAKAIAEEKKASVVKGVLELFDKNGDGIINREEWMNGWVQEGKRLPDFGVGVFPCDVDGGLEVSHDLLNALPPSAFHGWVEHMLYQEGWEWMLVACFQGFLWLWGLFYTIVMYRFIGLHREQWKKLPWGSYFILGGEIHRGSATRNGNSFCGRMSF